MAPLLASGLFALLAAATTALHLRRRRQLPRHELPTAHWLPVSEPRRRRRRELERPLLLAIRLAILLLLLLAALGPTRALPEAPGRPGSGYVAIVLDASASMAQGGRALSALGRAKERARAVVEEAQRAGARVSLTIVDGNKDAGSDVGYTEEAAPLVAAIEAAKAGGAALLGPVIARHLSEPESPRVVVVFDGAAHALGGTPAPPPPSSRLVYEDVLAGTALRRARYNDAIRIERAGWVSLEMSEVEIRVRRDRGPAGPRTLSLLADGRLVERRQMRLEPGEEQAWSVRWSGPIAGCAIEARLEAHAEDLLEHDDIASTELPARAGGAYFALVPPGEGVATPLRYVERALRQVPPGLPELRVVRYEGARTDPASLRPSDRPAGWLLFDGAADAEFQPPGERGGAGPLREASWLRGQGAMQFLGEQSREPSRERPATRLLFGRLRDPRAPTMAPAGGRRLGSVSWRHPMLRSLGPEGQAALELARIFRYWQVEALPAGAEAVIALDDGSPLLLAMNDEGGRSAVLTTTAAPAWNDLALQGAFVPLMQGALAWVAHADAEPQAPSEGRAEWGKHGRAIESDTTPVASAGLAAWAGSTSSIAAMGAEGRSPAARARSDGQASALLALAALLVLGEGLLASASPKKAARVGVVP